MKFTAVAFYASSYSLFAFIIVILLMQSVKLYVLSFDSHYQSVSDSATPDSIFKVKNIYKITTNSSEEKSLSYRSGFHYELDGLILNNFNDNKFSSYEQIVSTNIKDHNMPSISVSTLNLSNLFEFNKIINNSKKVLFLISVYICNIFNLMFISYLMSKTSFSSRKLLSKDFLRFHFCINLIILVSVHKD